MKLSRIAPLYENVFQLMDMSLRSANNKRNNKQDGELSYEDAVKYMSVLVGFMLADRATKDNQDLLKRSYAPIGALYRASPDETKAALDKFWSALKVRPLELGSRDVKSMVQKYYKFLENGDQEQWSNVVSQLRAYFADRQSSVRTDAEEMEPA